MLVAFDINPEMYQALVELSIITETKGKGDDARVATFLGVAARIYEWCIFQQHQGRHIALVDDNSIRDLKKTKGEQAVEDGLIKRLYPERFENMVKSYFERAKERGDKEYTDESNR